MRPCLVVVAPTSRNPCPCVRESFAHDAEKRRLGAGDVLEDAAVAVEDAAQFAQGGDFVAHELKAHLAPDDVEGGVGQGG